MKELNQKIEEMQKKWELLEMNEKLTALVNELKTLYDEGKIKYYQYSATNIYEGQINEAVGHPTGKEITLKIRV